MTNPTNWNEIRKAADKAGFFHGWMAAEENAAETTKTTSGPEFERIALSSLCEALAYNTLDKAEHDFFVALGVQF
ncbi:hypothetical protein EOA32_00735 [Mesorhizobium sp. M1A.F.Ca.ET.072.01.1.1]|uniref:hypothetical protein n=1 Tax=Mesorhizobium sp. M1A.F.Ca.ET.072.01.1.1 TaxID=2496753 RepID=UPI000FD5D6D3|nr:hypothetical protein [Mesorhizobium sp. M1A.F.Ca.ET.072.01.1.1]RUW55577.1 hypothetical protein EOA32_00735 [Mesorhizobium sp. M1A.F.Ca.ET.072.01.1.1]